MYQFFAVIRTPELETDLLRIPVSQPVQQSLTDLFDAQRSEFLKIDTEFKEFEATLRLECNELFELKGHELPSYYATALAAPQTIDELDNAFQPTAPIVKAIVASDEENQAFYFQSFNRSHILDRQRTLFLRSNTFQQLSQPAVQIDRKLAAVYRDGNLYFRSFHAVKQFLPLDEIFKEATDGDVLSILGHSKLFVAEPQVVLACLSARARKKFSLVIASGILDHPNATPTRIQRRSGKFPGLEVKIKKIHGSPKIVFPRTSGQIEHLLRFLAEEFYISEITEQPRSTNSHEKYKELKV